MYINKYLIISIANTDSTNVYDISFREAFILGETKEMHIYGFSSVILKPNKVNNPLPVERRKRLELTLWLIINAKIREHQSKKL